MFLKKRFIQKNKLGSYFTAGFIILSTLTFLIACGDIIPAFTPQPAISRHLEYSGFGETLYQSYTKESRYLELSDGVKVGMDIFLPAEKRERGELKNTEGEKFPTVLVLTPYNRAVLIPNLSVFEKLAAYWKYGMSGPIFDATTRPDVRQFLARGYAVIYGDMRGAGASTGSQVPFTPVLARDAEETIRWLTRQSWSNGKLCMMGRSYLGWIQLMVAARKVSGLKCILPEVIVAESYSEGLRPGGIDAIAWIEEYTRLLSGLNESKLERDKMLVPAAPVVDEDGDGELADELPLNIGGDPRSFLDTEDQPPRYADGSARKNIFYDAIKAHRDNVPFRRFRRRNAPYIDSQWDAVAGDLSYIQGSPAYYLPEIVESGVAIYNIGGWFDGFVPGTSKLYATMRAAGVKNLKLHIGPRFHYKPFMTDAYREFFNYPEDYSKQIVAERLRFIDYHLKGIPNGINEEAPVHIYVMHRGWRAEREWPLARQKITRYYLGKNNRLAPNLVPAAGASPDTSPDYDEYNVDFAHQSLYGENRVNRWLMMYLPDAVMERSASDRQALTYDTEILTADREVTGHPIVKLYVSSNQADGDFHVYLTDVDPRGKSFYVTEGRLRAGWHRTYPDDSQVKNRIDIKPDLPWHGFRTGQYSQNPLAGGKIRKLEFALSPTSYVFRKGHKMRLVIAGADAENFEMNPNLCAGDKPADCPATRIRVHRSKIYASRIELPIIKEKKEKKQ